jgi:hypothetical protein
MMPCCNTMLKGGTITSVRRREEVPISVIECARILEDWAFSGKSGENHG